MDHRRRKGYPARSRRRVTHDPDYRPLLLSDTDDTNAALHDADGEDEGVPLLSSQSSLLGNSLLLGVTDDKSRQQDVHFHAPNLQAAARARRRANHRHQRHGQYNNYGVIRNENPAKDMAGLCSYGCCCIQCVRTNEVGILHTFGQFQRLLKPGLICMAWPCTRLGRLSLRVHQLDVTCETKSRDSVFVTVGVAVQYRVLPENAFEAFYSLSNPNKQIMAFVFDVVRSTLPRMDIDDIFISKDDIALDVLRSLQSMMHRYGYEIVETLLTDISPDQLVKWSMNEINAAKRMKEAAPYKAEAEKVMKVKMAEAAAETLYLEGVGVANARKALSSGMKKCLLEFDNDSITPKHVMDLLLVSHYMDTLNAVGANSAILFHEPQEVASLRDDISAYFLPSQSSSAAVESNKSIPDLLS